MIRWLFALPLALLLGACAAWRRRSGYYDRSTLRLRWWAYWLRPGAAQLVALASFRRDLGRTLPRRWQAQIAVLQSQGRKRLQRRLLGVLQDGDAATARAMAEQRARFAEWWARQVRAPGGVCVVGNAAGLLGAALGERIDGHAAVVRFNRWQGPGVSALDTGSRIDIWVCSPSLRADPPEGISWAIISGPDPSAQMRRWPIYQRLEQIGVPVLTVPLSIWCELVRALHAPPSAGLLVLAWLRDLEAHWGGVATAGIGWRDPGGQHHVWASRWSVGQRHRWDAEEKLMRAWWSAGLSDLRARGR